MNVSRSVLGATDLYCLGSPRQYAQPILPWAPSSSLLSAVSKTLYFQRKRTLSLGNRQRTITTAASGNSTGSNNRLGPTNPPSPVPISASSTRSPSSSLADENSFLAPICNSFSEFVGKTLYKYYNWRQDTLSDLQLFMVLNAVVIALGAVLRGRLAPGSAVAPEAVDALTTDAPIPPSWWQDLYSVLTVVLGQELPEEQASNFPQQLFAVTTAVLGLASFALVLALIEQATLELLENNVRRGSRVYEKDHYVILTYGESARDLSQVQTITEQICAASTSSGGAVIVILVAHREKLEMETLFRENLPKEARCGSQIVFRQGSPLDPGALEMVSATDARAIIISGDYSRSVEDSDAQVLRCAVLVDEMAAAEGKEWIEARAATPTSGVNSPLTSAIPCDNTFGKTGGMGPWVVAEVQGTNVLALLQYACTSRVIPVPSSTINARRYARLLKHPAVATLSHALFDHKSRSNCHVGYFPDATYLVGQRYADLHAFFPDAIVSGVIDINTWKSELSCPPDRILKQGEALVMLRPPVGKHTLRPLRHPVPDALDPGSNWDPNLYSLRSVDDAPLGKDASGVRVCFWNHNNNNSLSSIDSAAAGNGSMNSTTTNGTVINNGINGGADVPHAPPPRGPSTEVDSDDDWTRSASSSFISPGFSGESTLFHRKRGGRSSNQLQSSRRLGAALLPLSYGSSVAGESSADGIGSDLLICGWPGTNAMVEFLKEVDHGVEALPKGSRVILLNDHSWEEVYTHCTLGTTIQRLDIKHVKCDPRDRQALSKAIDVATLRAAVILHDKNWGLSGGATGGVSGSGTLSSINPSPSGNDSSIPSAATYRAAAEVSAYALSQSDMLRMDAAVLEVQLNVRYLLEAACCPDINILSEKLTYLGQTRFENRNELPIGAAVNSASFAAKVLAQTAVQPRSLTAYAQVGVQCEIVVQDAAAFAKEGKELNFFKLQARAASVSQVLLGYYDLPDSIDAVLNIVVNPDEEDRMVTRVWNAGNARCKLITLAPRAEMAKAKSSKQEKESKQSGGSGGEKAVEVSS